MRYSEAGFSISEYDLQLASGVLQLLVRTANPPSIFEIETKQNIMYQFWTRPTINWELSCEEEKPKSEVIEMIQALVTERADSETLA